MLTKLSKHLRYGCENTHTSAVSLSHRAAVDETIPTSLMNVQKKTVRTWHIDVLGCGLSCNSADCFCTRVKGVENVLNITSTSKIQIEERVGGAITVTIPMSVRLCSARTLSPAD